MDAEVEDLKRQVEALPKRGKRRIYTIRLKRKILEVVERLVATGTTASMACEAIGIHHGTVSDWKGRRRRRQVSKTRSRVRPVELVGPSATTELTLVLPGGARVEGLRLEQVIELARALR